MSLTFHELAYLHIFVVDCGFIDKILNAHIRTSACPTILREYAVLQPSEEGALPNAHTTGKDNTVLRHVSLMAGVLKKIEFVRGIGTMHQAVQST